MTCVCVCGLPPAACRVRVRSEMRCKFGGAVNVGLGMHMVHSTAQPTVDLRAVSRSFRVSVRDVAKVGGPTALPPPPSPLPPPPAVRAFVCASKCAFCVCVCVPSCVCQCVRVCVRVCVCVCV